MSQCLQCGRLYDEDSPQQRLIHRQSHVDTLRGPAIGPYGVTIGRRGALRLRWMKPPQQIRKKHLTDLLLLGELANRETHYDGGVYRDPGLEHLLLAYRARRVVAVVVLDGGGRVLEARWNSDRGFLHLDDTRADAAWRVAFAWCLPRERGHGLAAWMLSTFAAKVGIETAALGWHVPFTNSGEALARRLSPNVIWAAR